MFRKECLALSLFAFAYACGNAKQDNNSHVNGTASQDLVFKVLREEFRTAVSTLPAERVVPGHQLDCLYQWGVQDQFVTGRFGFTFGSVSGFATAEISFDDVSGLNLILLPTGRGMTAQLASFPGMQISKPMEMYVRSSTIQKALMLEWTIDPWEYFQNSNPDGTGSIRAANTVTDQAITNAQRQVVFYARCM